MRTKLKYLLALAFVGSTCWLAVTATRAGDEDWKANGQSLYTTNTTWLLITNTPGTPFLTISNRPYVQFESGSCVVRVTDAEWNTITNHYRKNIKTNSLTFYGK